MKTYSEEMRSAPKFMMMGLFDYIESIYGSVEKYLVSIGFSLEEQAQLRENLTIDSYEVFKTKYDDNRAKRLAAID